MLKQALLSTIFATATFGCAGAQSPQNEQTGPGAAGSSSPSESRPKQDDEAAPSRKGKAERESKPHKKGQDVKKERADTRNDEPTTRRDAGDAAEPVQDRAAKRKKREKERPANDEPPRVTGPSERETLRPATKTGESEARPAKGAETDSSGAKLEDGRQPAQNEDSGKSKDAEGPKPVQDRDRDAVTKDVPRQGEETAKSRRNVDRNEVDRRDSEQGPKSFDRPDQPEPRDIAEPTPNPRTAPEVKKQEVMPADEQKAKEVIREERVRADEEFEKAKERAKAAPAASTDSPRLDERAASKFEQVRKERRERVERGGVALIEEPDKRVIVREKDRAFIQHDEGERLRRSTKELRRERRSDGTTIVVNLGIGGVEITSIFNDEGQLLRRSRHERGRDVVLIDNSDFYRRHRGQRFVNAYVDLPPLALNIPRAKYVVEYEDASEDEVYDALIAPPLERLDRGYSLEEVRQSYRLRERMRRVDLDAINFAFASWEVDANQYPKLERVADAIKRIIERNPDEVFMIEGHTDAVGSDIDNLSLSDRRAETVAIILSDTFRVPPENLVTQGYGEQFLKVETEAPSRENRRVAVRRVTPLLSRNQRQTRDQ